MLASGVSLNNSLLNPKHNSSTSNSSNNNDKSNSTSNDPTVSINNSSNESGNKNSTVDDEIILDGDNSSDVSEMNSEASKTVNDSKRKVVDLNNNTKNATAWIDEDEKLNKMIKPKRGDVMSTAQSMGNQPGDGDEFKKFYSLISNHQQNPNFMAIIAAAASAAAMTQNQNSDANAGLSSEQTAANQQALYMQQLQISLLNQNFNGANVLTDPANSKNYGGEANDATNFDPIIKKLKKGQEIINNNTDEISADINCQKNRDGMDYRMNKSSKSHHHHHKSKSQHKATQPETTGGTGEPAAQKLSPNSSINSYSSSSISSESSNSSSSPPPLQQQQQQQQSAVITPSDNTQQQSKIQSKHEKFLENYETFNKTFKPHPKPSEQNNNYKQQANKHGLLQSMLVPKLQHTGPVHPFKINADDFSLLNLSHININANKSSDNIHSHMSNKFNNIPKKSHFPANNQSPSLNASTPTLSNSASASSEVKLKLKNSILQKQLIAKFNSNINQMSGSAHNQNNSINVTRSQSYLIDSQNQLKQSMQSMLQHSHLTNINENNVYQQQQQQQQGSQCVQFANAPLKDRNHYQAKPEYGPAPKQANLSTKHMELLNQLDENNLRRTTSEPNLKVKSALKDRLLEKRNLLNPFPAKRPSKQQQSPPAAPQPIPVHKAQKSAGFTPQQPMGVSMSTSSLIGSNKLYQQQNHNQQKNYAHHQHQQYNNEQLLGALAHAVGQSTPELMSLQKQQLAASALLSLSHSQTDMSNDQKAYDVHVTLRELQQQQQQQNSINPNNYSGSSQQQMLESLALARALGQQNLNHHQLLQLQKIYELQELQESMTKELAPSLSYPMLPNQLMLNALNFQKHRQQHQNQSNDVETSATSNKPKFGHAVHVEEENEMLLENELKIAAKLNDTHTALLSTNTNSDKSNESSPNEETDMCEMPVRNSYSSLFGNRSLLASTSAANINQQSLRFGRNHHPHYVNQFYQHKLKDRSYKQNQQKMLHYNQYQQQELDEQLVRQKQFQQKNQSSFFSDPYLLKSMEINSQPNINKLEKKTHPSITSSSHAIPMDFGLDQSDERIYRYTTGLVYDTAMLKHECTCYNPSNHLETADRIQSIWSRFKARDLVDECELVTTKLASISDLLLTHNEQYALIFGSDIETRPKLPKEYLQTYMMNICLASCQGFALTYDQDNSWNEEHTPLACRVAIGSTFELSKLVMAGKLKNGFALVRPPGSHAEFNKPLGFCYFNTVATVAKMLKKNLGLERILIVDWDVHHGNGTQQMTYNDPNILYISLHRHDNGNFFPGTGAVDECGSESALGKNVNIAFNGRLQPPMSDAEYLAAFRCVVMPIAKAYKPQIVLVSCGFDGTENHPKELGGYKVSPMCFGYMTKKLMSLAEGKVVLALEGGYDKRSLCDCSEVCLNALTNKQIPAFPKRTLDSMPNSTAIEDLENVIEIQKQYWPDLKEYKEYIKMSQNQFINVINS